MNRTFPHHQEMMIKKCFNKAANTYDLYSQPQQLIGEKLLNSFDDYLDRTDNVIDLGCGSGFLTEKLAKKYTYQHFYAIDIADQLLIKARERLLSFNIRIEETNFQHFYYPECSFDLVFSNMALHWALNMQNTLLNISHNIAANGLLAFSIPLNNTFHELNKQAINPFYSKDEMVILLSNAEFIVLHYSTERIILYFDSLIDALKSIKAVGANYHTSHSPSLHGKSFLQTLTNSIHNKRFSLTYEIGFFIARKKYHGT